MEPWFVELVGRMRLEKTTSTLINRVGDENLYVFDAAGIALRRIGTKHVANEAARAWPRVTLKQQYGLIDPLSGIHLDLTAERCRTFLKSAEEWELGEALCEGILGHFDREGIEDVRQFIRESERDLGQEQVSLRCGLVAMCLITGDRFPEFDAWHRQAREVNWGWPGGDEWPQIADNFREVAEDSG